MSSSGARNRCQQLFWNLLGYVDGAPGRTEPCIISSGWDGFYDIMDCDEETSCAHVRNLDLTPKCDVFTDLSQMRRDFAQSLGDERMQEIRQQNWGLNGDSGINLKMAGQTAVHYKYWHRTQLISALSWSNRLYYAFIRKSFWK